MPRQNMFSSRPQQPVARSGAFGSVRGATIDRASAGLQASRNAVQGRTANQLRARKGPATANNRRQQLFSRRVGVNTNSKRNRAVPPTGRVGQQPRPAIFGQPRAQPVARQPIYRQPARRI